jgi:hypothetical protein
MDPTVPRANHSALDCRAAAHVVMTARVAVQGQKTIAHSFVECSQVTDGESRKQPGVPMQLVYSYQDLQTNQLVKLPRFLWDTHGFPTRAAIMGHVI